ncbi:uncharacterized protein L3040_001434 [Drepanopeziza brunnea f. sp. 'multigermtubi']|uniref:uncharacterized protein n=1 Tax=Drepanopeziza brunnea f. sp. 'multigermtubi' TaxID=698441 RepID=UPI002399183F|nr:hypothetical protein L3040_001434 [Drepanopeziza brunnea f. sp. 'multigermtubi']
MHAGGVTRDPPLFTTREVFSPWDSSDLRAALDNAASKHQVTTLDSANPYFWSWEARLPRPLLCRCRSPTRAREAAADDRF